MATQENLIEDVKTLVQDATYSTTDILDYLNEGQSKIAGGVLLLYPDGTQVRSAPLPNLATSDSLSTSTTYAYIDMSSDYDRDLYFCASSTNTIRVKILGSLAELLDYYPVLDNTGQVRFVALSGKSLYYQGMPSTSETLDIYYFRTPYDMEKYTAGTISFANSTGKISDAASGLSDFHVGQTIDVTGSSDNNDDFTITAVASDGSSVTVSESLTDEAAGSSVTIQSRPDGIPVYLQEDLLVNYAGMKIFERKAIQEDNMLDDLKRCRQFFNQAMLNLEASVEREPESVEFKSSRD